METVKKRKEIINVSPISRKKVKVKKTPPKNNRRRKGVNQSWERNVYRKLDRFQDSLRNKKSNGENDTRRSGVGKSSIHGARRKTDFIQHRWNSPSSRKYKKRRARSVHYLTRLNNEIRKENELSTTKNITEDGVRNPKKTSSQLKMEHIQKHAKSRVMNFRLREPYARFSSPSKEHSVLRNYHHEKIQKIKQLKDEKRILENNDLYRITNGKVSFERKSNKIPVSPGRYGNSMIMRRSRSAKIRRNLQVSFDSTSSPPVSSRKRSSSRRKKREIQEISSIKEKVEKENEEEEEERRSFVLNRSQSVYVSSDLQKKIEHFREQLKKKQKRKEKRNLKVKRKMIEINKQRKKQKEEVKSQNRRKQEEQKRKKTKIHFTMIKHPSPSPKTMNPQQQQQQRKEKNKKRFHLKIEFKQKERPISARRRRRRRNEKEKDEKKENYC